jgi:hypothetical protein
MVCPQALVSCVALLGCVGVRSSLLGPAINLQLTVCLQHLNEAALATD